MYKLILEKTAYTPAQLSGIDIPQIALAGRSNVGKSSLINTLGGSKKLARTSSSPGKTRSINFYMVQPSGFSLVDLPGYGYAKCSKTEREKWSRLIEAYIQDNFQLKAVVHLLDSRLEPQALDLELSHYVQSLNIPILPVLTKSDKCKQKQLTAISRTWSKILGLNCPPVVFSAKTGAGRDKLWELIIESATP
ncbi:ribosome biogenesis GTP-binding protein YihA/YsxC [Desulfonatronovibrio magnus]|uniref:ribosome biogenesis GTP-binding protein YihA/YsxC n=1 Tax=Desulfonatronovibrio magnus TaxID=698827 RepID=UPI0005EB3DA8|nr:ribosome biogenesis GTP-binding protein YihA/YsxC [Desulfonatronovibrio magnus]